jgi:hypothetical protein
MASPRKKNSAAAAGDTEAEPLLLPAGAAALADPSHEHDGSCSSSSPRSTSGPAAEPRTCRICFDTEESAADSDPDNPLINPCQCAGSSRYVHRQCLDQWRHTSHRQDAFYQCEVPALAQPPPRPGPPGLPRRPA